MSPKTSKKKNKAGKVLAKGKTESRKEKVLASWRTPEFITYKRNFWWVFLAIVILILVEVYLLYTKQWLASVVFLTMSIAVYRYSKMEPKEVECKITESGIHFGQRFYSFYSLRSYWIIEDILTIEPNRRFAIPINIPLKNVGQEKIIQALGNYIPQQRKKVEELVSKITRLLKL